MALMLAAKVLAEAAATNDCCRPGFTSPVRLRRQTSGCDRPLRNRSRRLKQRPCRSHYRRPGTRMNRRHTRNHRRSSRPLKARVIVVRTDDNRGNFSCIQLAGWQQSDDVALFARFPLKVDLAGQRRCGCHRSTLRKLRRDDQVYDQAFGFRRWRRVRIVAARRGTDDAGISEATSARRPKPTECLLPPSGPSRRQLRQRHFRIDKQDRQRAMLSQVPRFVPAQIGIQRAPRSQSFPSERHLQNPRRLAFDIDARQIVPGDSGAVIRNPKAQLARKLRRRHQRQPSAGVGAAPLQPSTRNVTSQPLDALEEGRTTSDGLSPGRKPALGIQQAVRHWRSESAGADGLEIPRPSRRIGQ